MMVSSVVGLGQGASSYTLVFSVSHANLPCPLTGMIHLFSKSLSLLHGLRSPIDGAGTGPYSGAM